MSIRKSNLREEYDLRIKIKICLLNLKDVPITTTEIAKISVPNLLFT